MRRLVLQVHGIVQGVGFRPAVYRLATQLGLCGYVSNTGHNVVICVEGTAEKIQAFRQALSLDLPPAVRIEHCEENWLEAQGDTFFLIKESAVIDGRLDITIPIDLAICAQCRQEVLAKDNRHYNYPFTCCTDCGPRFTVIKNLPYDRIRSSLAEFPLCSDCLSEYQNPADRRFHAEGIACPSCGPAIWLHNYTGSDHLARLRHLLQEGKIVALRGIGGFQLCCDANNRLAIQKLRFRKKRPHKPLAVMGRDLNVLRQYCQLTAEEEQVLSSERAPILLVRTKPQIKLPLDLISPDTPELLGVMLPTSPLHLLLFTDGQNNYHDFLIMTSGNLSGEPICLTNAQALQKLSFCADNFLFHNREILRISDDSVGRWHNQFFLLRRARGYVPESIKLPLPIANQVLALGADLKNTLCFAFPNYAILSQHIGDLHHLAAAELQKELVLSWSDFFNFSPQCVAIDFHPDFTSSALGRKIALAKGLKLHMVQHHHAHAMAVMAEHGLTETLAVILDGHGYGLDDSIWGAELLQVRLTGFERLASWQNIALIGGERMALQPQRSAFSALAEAGEQILAKFFHPEIMEPQRVDNLAKLRQFALFTSSAGRYFDAAAFIAGCALEQNTYEGQAAIRLEYLARKFYQNNSAVLTAYPLDWYQDQQGLWRLNLAQIMTAMWQEARLDQQPAMAAFRFHITVAQMILEMALFGRKKTGISILVLSGGVFQNMLLLDLCLEPLAKAGFQVYLPEKLPCNDGSISFGQAVVAGYCNGSL